MQIHVPGMIVETDPRELSHLACHFQDDTLYKALGLQRPMMELIVPMAHMTQEIRNTPLLFSHFLCRISRIIYRSMIIYAHLYKAEEKQSTIHTSVSLFFCIISGVHALTCSVKRHKEVKRLVNFTREK
jgi:hypothetical protein